MAGLTTVNSILYWSRATITELSGRVYIKESSQKILSLYSTKYEGGPKQSLVRKGVVIIMFMNLTLQICRNYK